MQDEIPSLLGKLELWVQSGAGTVTAERRARVREALDAIQAKYQVVRTVRWESAR